MAIEQGVSLQQDQLSNVAGGPARTILTTVSINGVPTQVQMQVVSIADERGMLFEAPVNNAVVLEDILAVLCDIRTLLSFRMGLSVSDQTKTPVNAGITL